MSTGVFLALYFLEPGYFLCIYFIRTISAHEDPCVALVNCVGDLGEPIGIWGLSGPCLWFFCFQSPATSTQQGFIHSSYELTDV